MSTSLKSKTFLGHPIKFACFQKHMFTSRTVQNTHHPYCLEILCLLFRFLIHFTHLTYLTHATYLKQWRIQTKWIKTNDWFVNVRPVSKKKNYKSWTVKLENREIYFYLHLLLLSFQLLFIFEGTKMDLTVTVDTHSTKGDCLTSTYTLKKTQDKQDSLCETFKPCFP